MEKVKKESEKEMQKKRNKIMFDYIGETIIRNFIFITFIVIVFWKGICDVN